MTARQSSNRVMLTSLLAMLAPLAKAAGGGEPGAPPTAAPPQAGDTAGAPSPGGGSTEGLVTALDQASQALAALKEEVAAGGMPEGLDEKLKTIAGVLLSLTGDSGGDTAKRAEALTKVLRKALLPEVEMKITLDAARDKLWGVQDLLRENKLEEAKAALATAVSMINSVSGGEGATGATPAGKAIAKAVTMTAPQFGSWAQEQLAKAATEPRTECAKRMTAVGKVVRVAKDFWEQTGAEAKPITVEIEEAYVGSAGGGTAQDLTTKGDQKTTETSATDTGASDQSNFAENSAEVLGKAVAALVAQFNTNQPTNDVAGLTKADGSFNWPSDVSRLDDKPLPAINIAKRDALTDWGEDPTGL